tara:strand:+ start:16 stop:213 length:198 start_codon:yes stop_codon:yes gene_type:complete
MSKFSQWLINFSTDYFVKYLVDNKALVIEKINKKFDVPLLNEKQEAELLGIVHEIIVDVAKDMKK